MGDQWGMARVQTPKNRSELCLEASFWAGEHGGETLDGQKLPCGCPDGCVLIRVYSPPRFSLELILRFAHPIDFRESHCRIEGVQLRPWICHGARRTRCHLAPRVVRWAPFVGICSRASLFWPPRPVPPPSLYRATFQCSNRGSFLVTG